MFKSLFIKLFFLGALCCLSFITTSFIDKQSTVKTAKQKIIFPYAKEGLSKEQAAEHLLSRFTFGVRQKDIDEALKVGLENWFEQQLQGKMNDAEVDKRLVGYDALQLSSKEIMEQYPKGPQVRKMALKDGFITKEEVKNDDNKELNKKLREYREKKGLKNEADLLRQFINQKIIKATYSNNQLHELLADFWFNHFNVSLTKNQSTHYVPSYERDAIRPNVTSKFEDLLLATAKHPAMLTYLDNFTSTGQNEAMDKFQERRIKSLEKSGKMEEAEKVKARGLNENYAREVMELHTLGVDGGYTQNDVTEAARVLTGWTIYPNGEYGNGQLKKMLEKMETVNIQKQGFVIEGDFLFAPILHDTKTKTVLGKTYNQGGYDEGLGLLKNLANHKSTASFISKKLATRFVNDQPDEKLVTAMSSTYLKTNGDIKAVLLTMVQHPSFWTKAARREKTKSPFEYAISSVRALNADVKMPFQINTWITKMGQRMYFYQAPTGFPDKAQHWINTGSLLNRMNFGLALAGKRIPGVEFDLGALNNHHEPESAEDALYKYGKILLPQRDLTSTYKRLIPLIQNDKISEKINNAAEKNNPQMNTIEMTEGDNQETAKEKVKQKIKTKDLAVTLNNGDNSMLAQVAGIIIGSPEFQRK